jgi:hypothetical protein
MVCGKDFDTGALLLDRRLRDMFDHKTMTGMGLCPDHESLFQRGYIALVECDAKLSAVVNDIVKPGEEYRTGTVMHIRKRVWEKIFDSECPDSPMVFMEIGVIDKLKEMGIAPEES